MIAAAKDVDNLAVQWLRCGRFEDEALRDPDVETVGLAIDRAGDGREGCSNDYAVDGSQE